MFIYLFIFSIQFYSFKDKHKMVTGMQAVPELKQFQNTSLFWDTNIYLWEKLLIYLCSSLSYLGR